MFSVTRTSRSHGDRTRPQRGGIDVDAVRGDVGIAGGAFEEDAAEERHRRQHVGLVDARDAGRASGRRRRRASANADSNSRSEPCRVMRIVSRTASSPSRRLSVRAANNPSVDSRTITKSMARARGSASGMRTPGSTRIGRMPGVELEAIAKVDLRHDLGAVGIADVGVPHRAEEDGVGGRRRAQCLLGKRDSGLQIELRAGLVRFEPQPDAARLGRSPPRAAPGTAP